MAINMFISQNILITDLLWKLNVQNAITFSTKPRISISMRDMAAQNALVKELIHG